MGVNLTGKTLFIEPISETTKNSKKCFNKLWREGKAFKSVYKDTDEILSINSIDKYRSLYDRIYIQYSLGVFEV